MVHMIKFALTTILAGALVTAQADEVSHRSVFAYSKEMGLSGQLRAVHDIVILKDGSYLQGKLSSVPVLKFSFGPVNFTPDEISLIATTDGPDRKIKIKTRSGETYVGSSQSNAVAFAGTQLDLDQVDCILVKSRGQRELQFSGERLHVTLQSGDQFPVEIADRYIELSDGWSQKRIDRSQVIDLFFNGGLFGTIKENREEIDLPLSFVKQQSIRFVAPLVNHHIQVPWKQIVRLSRFTDRLAVEEQFAVVERSSEGTLIRFAVDHPTDRIQEVDFIEGPLPLFSENADLPIPDDIVFLEDPQKLFDQKDLVELERMFAVGEDFDFDDEEIQAEDPEEDAGIEFVSQCQGTGKGMCLAVGEDFDLNELDLPTAEDNESEEGFEFISGLAADIGGMLAVGVDFVLDELEETVEENGQENEEFEFLSYLDRIVAVGEHFNLDDLDETVQEQEEETIEFVKKLEVNVPAEQPLAYRGCPCIKSGHTKPMPHADFSMDDEEDVELIKVVEEIPAKEWLEKATPAIPEVPKQNGQRREEVLRTVPSRLEFEPRIPVIPKESIPAREFDGLVYVQAAHHNGSGFYIKPKKITNREYKKFVDAINYRSPIHWVGDAIPKGMEDEPVVNVSYRDAFLYSVWAGKRLPTEEELQRAVEAGAVLTDPNNQTAEWTSTPTLRSVRYPQSGTSVKIGQNFTPSHQVFSRYRIVSMSNNDFNNYTGFRTAVDGH